MSDNFLYYTRAIDSIMMIVLNDIASEKARAIERTLIEYKRTITYEATYPNTFLCFYASNIIMYIGSDAAYLVKPEFCSQVAFSPIL